MAIVPFGKPSKVAQSQDKRASDRMPKNHKGRTTEESFGRGDGAVRPVDPGDGLVRGNDIPKPVPGEPVKNRRI
jgi:hypothetical protein